MRTPQATKCFDIPFAFVLSTQGTQWECAEGTGGFITWNGKSGKELVMRVNQRDTFLATYSPTESVG